MALREILAHFGVSFDDKALKSGEKSIDGVVGKLGKLATAAAGALAGSAIVKGAAGFVEAIAEQGDQLGDLAERYGISTDALQEWGFAAAMSGAEAEDVTMALGKLQMAAGSGADAFSELGVSARDASGQLKSADALLEDVAEKFEKIQSPTEKTNKAMKLFGRSGAKLVPLLSRGKKGIAELRKEFKELGGGFSTEAVESAARYKDSIERLNVTWSAFKSKVGGFVLPLAEKFIGLAIRASNTVGGWVDALKPLIQRSNILTGAAVALGVALVAAFAPAVIAALPVIATLAAIAFAVDELVTAWQGGDTLIGRAIDNIFGAGSTQKAVAFIKDVVKSTSDFFSNTTRGWAEFTAGVQLIWSDLVNWIKSSWIGLAFSAIISNEINSIISAVTFLADAFTAVWNGIISGAKLVAKAIGTVIDAIPIPVMALLGKGARALTSGPAVDQAAIDRQRQAIIDRSVVSNATAQVPSANTANVTNSVNVTVPPGTPANVARDVGEAVRRNLQPSTKALKNQLVKTAG
jgi:hypothetical protein